MRKARRRRKLPLRWLVAGLLALLLLPPFAFGLWFLLSLRPPEGGGSAAFFAVRRGETLASVARRLEERGLVRSARAFLLLARLKGLDREVKAGGYRLKPGWAWEVLDALVRGRREAVWVTFPEGFTARQMARRLAKLGLADERRFMRLFRMGRRAFPEFAFLPKGKTLEGYLFPDTYLIEVGIDERGIIGMLLRRFEEVVVRGLAGELRRSPLSLHEVVTLASLVEKEAKLDEERPLIAGVLLNRLRRGMRLECNASLLYVLGEPKLWLTKRDISIDSPYNTYRRPGLPPGPICNPGRPSILAVLKPKRTDFLFYVARPDGRHYFSRTYREHLKFKARAKKEWREAEGRSSR